MRQVCEDHLKSQIKSKISPCRDESLSIPFALYRETTKLTDFFLFLHYISFCTHLRLPCLVNYFAIYLEHSINHVGLMVTLGFWGESTLLCVILVQALSDNKGPGGINEHLLIKHQRSLAQDPLSLNFSSTPMVNPHTFVRK